MSLRIYGAGMAGLLASVMLRRYRPLIFEAQPMLPDNHGALLRFRTDAVARETALPFRRVHVLKAVKSNGEIRTTTTMTDANRYSLKVTGEIRPRSVLDLAPVDRYIAPDDFLTMLARDAILNLDMPLTLDRLEAEHDKGDAVISTIPMPVLMKIVSWPNVPQFRYRPIWSVTVPLLPDQVDVFQTIYYPGEERCYRASITGSRLILEYTEEPSTPEIDVGMVLRDFGLPLGVAGDITGPKRQEYGKLLPIPDAIRQEFILAMSDRYNLYSVGRFATWRQILLDDVVEDIRKVERWINQRNSYAHRLETAR